MRPDMAKVLVERPRRGGCRGAVKGYRRDRQRIALEDQASREGIAARSRGGTKWLSDHLGPLRRFLRSNVGRPWDLVYSEICAHVRGGPAVREHFLRHVFEYVERHVVEIDGVLCHAGSWGYGRPLGIWQRHQLYVCPRSGLLRSVDRRRSGRTGRGGRPSRGP